MSDVKYPDIVVRLTAEDGNAFFIIGKVVNALRKANVPNEEIEEFRKEAMSGDYHKVLATCMRWVTTK